MRASRAGFCHLLCADTFVFHEGEVSFGDSGTGRRATAQALIDERYPEFQPNLRSFLDREPARPLRRRVDLARLRASAKPRLLFITHHWGGGVERHVHDLARLLAADCEVLMLRPDAKSIVSLAWLREGEEFEAWFDASTDWPECVALLDAIGIARVHFHHVHGLPREVLDLPRALATPWDVTVHDHYPICPQYHLADETGRYCGEPNTQGCNDCIAKRPVQWGMDIVAWRNVFHDLLRKADRVIVPSSDLGARLLRYYPDVATVHMPHPETYEPIPALHKVVLLGAIAPIKGLRVLEACVKDAAARGLPLHFHVIGHLGLPLQTWPDAPLTVGGSFPEDKLAEIIALERPDAFLFLSQVPETYSYTLSTAMQTGLPIVSTLVGAMPERLRNYRAHALVSPDASAGGINDAILAALRPVEPRPASSNASAGAER